MTVLKKIITLIVIFVSFVGGAFSKNVPMAEFEQLNGVKKTGSFHIPTSFLPDLIIQDAIQDYLITHDIFNSTLADLRSQYWTPLPMMKEKLSKS